MQQAAGEATNLDAASGRTYTSRFPQHSQSDFLMALPVHPNFPVADAVCQVRTQIKRISGGDEINIWYIIGGVIGGLLLLVIIVLIAWRCGFFKRKNKAKLEKLKRQSGFYDSNRSMKKKGRASSSGSAPDKSNSPYTSRAV
ncbi:uncharacterized protein LOC143294235 [Babylonia areolata]|uniref:uncharacterized protein LOC143294235 n=1 Tax=Babylonia areolata TaxID=304850 RepID=UPI003FD5240F